MLKPLALFAVLPLLLQPAAAQEAPLPSLIKIVVPVAAGAGTDIVARAVANQLAPRLGTTVIVENRPGASGIVGADAVAKGPKDGSMLLLFSVSLVTAAATKPSMPFDLTKDLAPVAMLGYGPMVVAVPASSRIKTPADLVAAARAKGDGFTHGTAGIGTIAHLAAELLNDAGGLQAKHIPYRGAAPAVVDLASGTLDMMIAANSTVAGQVASGRLRLVGVTSPQPSPAFPGLPPIATAVPGYAADIWQAVWVPAGTPAPVMERLNREIYEVMKTKEMRESLQVDGFSVAPLKPAEVAARVRDSLATWKKLASAKGIVAE